MMARLPLRFARHTEVPVHLSTGDERSNQRTVFIRCLLYKKQTNTLGMSECSPVLLISQKHAFILNYAINSCELNKKRKKKFNDQPPRKSPKNISIPTHHLKA
ncbi:unnamed protein product [Ixodes pacificus]